MVQITHENWTTHAVVGAFEDRDAAALAEWIMLEAFDAEEDATPLRLGGARGVWNLDLSRSQLFLYYQLQGMHMCRAAEHSK